MSYQQYSPTGFRVLPPVVKNLLIINVLFYLATLAMGAAFGIDLTNKLGLHYFAASEFRPWQFVTYMFMHAINPSHIFFNMFALWMFGTVLEQVWGPKRFLIFYFVTGIGAALVHYVVFYFQVSPVLGVISSYLANPDKDTFVQLVNSDALPHIKELTPGFNELAGKFNSLAIIDPAQATQLSINILALYKVEYLNAPVVVGASGAIFGLLLAFGMLFPNSLIYIYFFIPLKAKWFVIIYGLIELVSGFYDTGSNVAHFAHLGGMLFGIILILIWRNHDKRKRKYYNYYQS